MVAIRLHRLGIAGHRTKPAHLSGLLAAHAVPERHCARRDHAKPVLPAQIERRDIVRRHAVDEVHATVLYVLHMGLGAGVWGKAVDADLQLRTIHPRPVAVDPDGKRKRLAHVQDAAPRYVFRMRRGGNQPRDAPAAKIERLDGVRARHVKRQHGPLRDGNGGSFGQDRASLCGRRRGNGVFRERHAVHNHGAVGAIALLVVQNSVRYAKPRQHEFMRARLRHVKRIGVFDVVLRERRTQAEYLEFAAILEPHERKNRIQDMVVGTRTDVQRKTVASGHGEIHRGGDTAVVVEPCAETSVVRRIAKRPCVRVIPERRRGELRGVLRIAAAHVFAPSRAIFLETGVCDEVGLRADVGSRNRRRDAQDTGRNDNLPHIGIDAVRVQFAHAGLDQSRAARHLLRDGHSGGNHLFRSFGRNAGRFLHAPHLSCAEKRK